ncbi:hypothetical protein HY448_01140 [Candidatus Pacearchaeota archaeon]|nr:hypothetical protein [Candidatus Pacearchaeota archaeon]
MKPKFVYHGSAQKINGKLIPKKAKDLRKDVNNSQMGIYASSYINEAIAMGILKSPGIKGGSISRGKFDGTPAIDAVMYGGAPKQKYFYLYTLSSKTFNNIPKESFQFVSSKQVKPIKIEKLLVKKYLHLIRKATKMERIRWKKLK